ncbi:MAG: CBS domain-containing protein [Pirellulaceae bacterium]
MVTELLRYPEQWTVHEVVADLQAGADEYRDYQIQYAYVCTQQGQLLGVLRLRDLLLGDRSRVIRDIMIPNPLSVSDHLRLDELHGFFQQHHFLGVPVISDDGLLVGVVQRADVDQAWIERQDRSMLRRQGIVSGEEIRSMPLWERASGRLSWLSLNIVLNLMAASIISHFEATLAAAIALTAFLPIISDMSGCSGNQSVAVSDSRIDAGYRQHEGRLPSLAQGDFDRIDQWIGRRCPARCDRLVLEGQYGVGDGGRWGAIPQYTGGCLDWRNSPFDTATFGTRSGGGLGAATDHGHGYVRVFLGVKFGQSVY